MSPPSTQWLSQYMDHHPHKTYLHLTNNFCMWGTFMLLLSSVGFFSKLPFSKNSFWNTIRVSNGLDPDQSRHSVSPDLAPNYLQRLSADEKIHC